MNNSVKNLLFQNSNSDKQEDEKPTKSINIVECAIDRFFNRIEKICILLWGEYFSEEDAACLFRLPDPKGKGKLTIRNYALRSKKIPFSKIGRHGLLFHRNDLEKLYQYLKAENIRDL